MLLKKIKSAPALAKSMHSLSSHVRMLAVVSVSLMAEDQAASYQKRLRNSVWCGQVRPESKVTEDLVQGLERLLEDSMVHVRVPSAITLYAISKPTAKV